MHLVGWTLVGGITFIQSWSNPLQICLYAKQVWGWSCSSWKQERKVLLWEFVSARSLRRHQLVRLMHSPFSHHWTAVKTSFRVSICVRLTPPLSTFIWILCQQFDRDASYVSGNVLTRISGSNIHKEAHRKCALDRWDRTRVSPLSPHIQKSDITAEFFATSTISDEANHACYGQLARRTDNWTRQQFPKPKVLWALVLVPKFLFSESGSDE